MSALSPQYPSIRQHDQLIVDDRRGTWGMAMFIATEGAMFASLFIAYYYLAGGNWLWPGENPPKLHYALPMLAVLALSSGVLYWGEQRVKEEKQTAGLLALAGTIVLGIVFLALTVFEYREHLGTLSPRSNAYGSIFYTITTIHAVHLILGLLMLGYVLLLPRIEPAERTPHRPFHNASLYWHFVETVWFFVVLFLYVIPVLEYGH